MYISTLEFFNYPPINNLTTIRQIAPGKPNSPYYDTGKKI